MNKLLVLASIFVSTIAIAQNKSLVCEETNFSFTQSGESVHAGRTVVKFGASGEPVSIQIKRPKLDLEFDGDKYPQDAVDLTFDLKNSKMKFFKDEINPNSIMEEGRLVPGGQENVRYDAVRATNSGGDFIEILINDHRYAGIVGSTINVKNAKGEETVELVEITECKDPNNKSQSSDDLEL